MAINVITTTLRSRIGLVVQNAVHFHMGARLFHHLIRLPLSFFEKRHIGDVLSRFQSIEPIRTVLAEGLILSVIDGIMAAATLSMIFLLSPRLGTSCCSPSPPISSFVCSLTGGSATSTKRSIQAGALENSNFIESARAIQSIKLFNRESDRESQWLNFHADTVNATIRRARIKVTFDTINQFIFGAENVLHDLSRGGAGDGGQLSVGAVFAFLSYKTELRWQSVDRWSRRYLTSDCLTYISSASPTSP